jgi:hypothetical protein
MTAAVDRAHETPFHPRRAAPYLPTTNIPIRLKDQITPTANSQLATRNSQLATRNGNFMAWAVLLLCVILGCLGTLRPSGRATDFKRLKEEG